MTRFDFNYRICDFDLRNGLRLAEFAKLAYKSQREIKKYTENKLGFSNFKVFDRKDTQAFMIGNDRVVILSFRGSQSIQDWITDFNVKLVKGPWGKVHRGFRKALNYVWKDIENTLNKFQDNKQTFWITGHSLGGALATLAAAKCIQSNIKLRGLYTFGQPRVGNKTFAKKFDAKIRYKVFRFVNNEDIVTRVPPRVYGGYSHIGRTAYFDTLGKLHKNIRWWWKFLDRSISKVARSIDRYQMLHEQFPNGIDDHSIDRYIKRIKKNLYKA